MRVNCALLSRRRFVGGSVAALAFACSPAASVAQSAKVAIAGWLASGASADPSLEAFRAGLRGLGYLEGTSIRVQVRSADDNSETLREFARELVRQQVDVIVSNGR